jgi:uncharacterized membrane protein YfhO
MNKLSSFFLGASLASFFLAFVSLRYKNRRARTFLLVAIFFALCALFSSDYVKDSFWQGFMDGVSGN